MRLYTCIFIISLLSGGSAFAQELEENSGQKPPQSLESEPQQQLLENQQSFQSQESEAVYEGILPKERLENGSEQTILVQGSDSLTQGLKPVVDSTKLTAYGLRIGGDLSKLLRTAFDQNYSGFELVGDLRFSKRFYAAVELGYEERFWSEQNLEAQINGSYIKLGADFNAYRNWTGMNNGITTGLRYGLSNFNNTLLRYPVYTTNPTFPSSIREDNVEYTGLTAGWVEFILAVKTELWSNFFLSLNVQLKHLIHEDTPGNFANLVIPGFNKTNDFSAFGVGYGYTLTYFIPVIKR